MIAKFDIFQKLPDGNPLWIKAVAGLEEARAQVAHLIETSPAEYFIYNHHTGSVIPVCVTSR